MYQSGIHGPYPTRPDPGDQDMKNLGPDQDRTKFEKSTTVSDRDQIYTEILEQGQNIFESLNQMGSGGLWIPGTDVPVYHKIYHEIKEPWTVMFRPLWVHYTPVIISGIIRK